MPNVSGLSPWFNLEAGKIESSEVFSRSLGQLMLQSWCSWSTFPTQEHLFLKLLTGPFITVVKFPRPPGAPAGLSKNPTTGQEGGSQPRKRRRVEEGDEEEITTNLHELIPRAYSPKLVVWCHHIFTDPHNPARGLSAALRYVLHCTTEDIIKRFDQGLQMEESSIFNFAGFTDDEFKETEEAQVRDISLQSPWHVCEKFYSHFLLGQLPRGTNKRSTVGFTPTMLRRQNGKTKQSSRSKLR